MKSWLSSAKFVIPGSITVARDDILNSVRGIISVYTEDETSEIPSSISRK